MDGWINGYMIELFGTQVALLLVNNVLISVGLLNITKIHMYLYKINVKLY